MRTAFKKMTLSLSGRCGDGPDFKCLQLVADGGLTGSRYHAGKTERFIVFNVWSDKNIMAL